MLENGDAVFSSLPPNFVTLQGDRLTAQPIQPMRLAIHGASLPFPVPWPE